MSISSKKHPEQRFWPLINPLNQNLANVIDLKLQAKQAHWNLKGENFIAVHELFDKVATAVDEYADLLAERVVQLGGIAMGTSQSITDTSMLKAYPTDIQQSDLHIACLSTAMKATADSTRKLIDTANELNDQVTADIAIEVARGLDKLTWFVESHLA